MRVGFTNGCFDLLHEGHRHLIRECQARCERLVISLNTDSSVRALKGLGRPLERWRLRAIRINRLLRPDDQIGFAFSTEDELLENIRLYRPDVIFKGADYKGQVVIGSDLAPVELIPMLPGYSTTNEIAKRDRLA